MKYFLKLISQKFWTGNTGKPKLLSEPQIVLKAILRKQLSDQVIQNYFWYKTSKKDNLFLKSFRNTLHKSTIK